MSLSPTRLLEAAPFQHLHTWLRLSFTVNQPEGHTTQEWAYSNKDPITIGRTYPTQSTFLEHPAQEIKETA